MENGILTNDKVLTIDQMKHLEKLNIDTSNASMCYFFWNNKPEEIDLLSRTPDEQKKLMDKNIGTVSNKSGFWNYTIIPAFTLGDLMKLIPVFDNSVPVLSHYKTNLWKCGYFESDLCMDWQAEGKTALEAAYNMVVLTAESLEKTFIK